jgi:hypothetical protein
MLRPKVSRPVCLGLKHPPLGLTTRSLLLSDSCGFVNLGRPLWREDGSVVYNCCCPSPGQSFSGPSPVGLVAIYYCLRFETSLSVASYDSQGHGGGIRPRLHKDGWCHRYITPLHGPRRKHCFQQFLYCCVSFAAGMFTDLFPSSGHLFLLIRILLPSSEFCFIVLFEIATQWRLYAPQY